MTTIVGMYVTYVDSIKNAWHPWGTEFVEQNTLSLGIYGIYNIYITNAMTTPYMSRL